MFNIIERFISRLNKNQVNEFALKNNVLLSEEELDFTYAFVMKNWRQVLGNPSLLEIDKYKNRYSEKNFVKIKKLLNEYSIKYSNFL